MPDFRNAVALRLEYEGAFGLDVLKQRENNAKAKDSLALITKEISTCTRCPLAASRLNTVPGEGCSNASVVFVGEGPGGDEDRLGRPFVGRAGKLLDQMLGAIGLDRTNSYIANIVKCRPPGNRNPSPEEVAACLPYLHRQLHALRPRLVVPLGSVAVAALLDPEARITRVRGIRHDMREWTIVPTYHPAYLLRNPSAKKEAWVDLQLIQAILSEAAEK